MVKFHLLSLAGNPLPTVRGGIQSGSFVYNQKECGVCGGIVFRWTINQRSRNLKPFLSSALVCCSFMTISVLSQPTDHLQLLLQLAK